MPDVRAILLAWALVAGLAPSAVAQMQCDCGDADHGSPVDMFGDWAGKAASSPITWSLVGLGFAGLGVTGWRLGWIPRAAGALFLWSRFDAHKLEEHPTRSRLLHLLRAHPGSSTRDLADLANLNPGTLLYHLEILTRFGVVNSQRVGRDRAWYVVRGALPDLQRLGVLAVPARQRILELLEATPGLTQADLAREVRLSAATVHHHLQALVEAGFVRLQREGARVRCFRSGLTNAAMPGQATFRPATPAT